MTTAWSAPLATFPCCTGLPASTQTGTRSNPGARCTLAPRGRICLCLLLAWGLCYGLMLLFTASLHALGKEVGGGAFQPVAGFALLAGLQALAILAVSVLAGAGQRFGTILGAVMGLMTGLLVSTGIISGLLTGLAQPFLREPLTQHSQLRGLVMFGLPVLHTLCGALGGFLGCLIWKPPLVFAVPRRPAVPTPGSRLAAMSHGLVASPTSIAKATPSMSWLRVLAGMSIAVCGGAYTQQTVRVIVQASEGYLHVATNEQHRIAGGVVFALALLLGGTVAGAATANGLKQGFCMGLGAAAVLVGLFLSHTASFSGSLSFVLLLAVVVGPLGGWFGSELLPPLGLAHCRKKRLR